MFKHPSRAAQDALHAPASVPLSDNDDSPFESSEYETEDSDGDELTPVMDAAILRTLGRIRRGEGVELGRNVFEEEQAALLAASSSALPSDKKKKKTKPMHLSDFQRRALLDASSSATGRPTADADEPTPWSHADEQARLREETLAAFGNAVESDDEDAADAGVFVKKSEAGPAGDELEDEEYRRFLVGNVGGGEAGVREALFGPGEFAQEGTAAKGASEEDEKARRKAEKKARKAAKLEGGTAPAVVDPEARRKEEEEFLLDYILNRGWIDRETVAAPSSTTLAASSKAASSKAARKAAAKDEGSALSADEDADEADDSAFEDQEEEFEVKYNFRFEEPGAEYITTHPRALPSLARREDTTRKTARAAKTERKAAEKLAREEDKKQRKAKKRAEIAKKLELLGLGKGGKGLEWNDLDLDEEFDDAAHERKMRELFDNAGDPLEGEDAEKPTWDDEDGGQEGYLFGMPDFGGASDDGGEDAHGGAEAEGMDFEGMDDVPEDDGEGAYADGPINMDADAPDDVPSTSKSKKTKKEQAKKAKKDKVQAKAVAAVKIGADEAAELQALAERGDAAGKKRKVDELMDEYDKLDYEDMIGNLPTRFHYAQTAPQSYGLTPTEILLATDAELNAFLGIKQYAAFRSDGGAGAGKVGRDKRLWELKKALKGRKWGEEIVDEGKGGKRYTGTGANGEKLVGKKRKGKKERVREQQAAAEAAAAVGGSGEGASASAPPPPPSAPAAAAGADEPKPKKKKRKVAAELM